MEVKPTQLTMGYGATQFQAPPWAQKSETATSCFGMQMLTKPSHPIPLPPLFTLVGEIAHEVHADLSAKLKRHSSSAHQRGTPTSLPLKTHTIRPLL